MNKEKIRSIVIECFAELVESEDPDFILKNPISETTDPFEDLRLTSRAGLEFTLDIEDALDIELPEGTNLFIKEEGKIKEKRSVGEIVDTLEAILNAIGEEDE